MAKKFVAPENLAELDADALSAAVDEAYESYKELAAIDEAEITDEQLADLEAIDGFVAAAKAENEGREQAAAARAERLASIKQNLETPAEEEVPAEDPAGAPAEDPAGAPAGDPAEEDPKAKEAEAAASAVAASVQRPAKLRSFAAKAAKNAPAPVEVPEAPQSKSRLFAANDVPGFKSGQEFGTLKEAGQAILNRLNQLPEGYMPGIRQQTSALQIQLPENEFSTAAPGYKGKDITDLIMDASKEARLPGGSLVAAGGWGAPSERSLDFSTDIESLDGLISVPEVTITRGGLEWTRGPNFGDVVDSSTGFWDMTEAVAEAGSELKTTIRPEVPDFEEARLDAVGVAMENGLLLRQGWPELVDRWATLTLLAHQYKLSQKKVAQIRALSGAATNIPNGFGNALDILHILEMLGNGERQRLMLSPTQTLEALIPWWVKSVIRVDLAQRNGVDTVTVTDAQIESHFKARNFKVQWIKGFQDLALDATTKLALTYPDTVEVIFYPAGTFVAGVAPVITLDTIYDSTNLKKNDYLHLFVEQGVLMTNPRNRGNRVTFPFFANGRRAGITDAAVTAGQNDSFANAPVANA